MPRTMCFESFPNVRYPFCTLFTGLVAHCEQGGGIQSLLLQVVSSKAQVVEAVRDLDPREAAVVLQYAASSYLPDESRRCVQQTDGFMAYLMWELIRTVSQAPDTWNVMLPMEERPFFLWISNPADLHRLGFREAQGGFALFCMTSTGAEVHLGSCRRDALRLLHERGRYPHWTQQGSSMRQAVLSSHLPEVADRKTLVIEGSSATNLLRAAIIFNAVHSQRSR